MGLGSVTEVRSVLTTPFSSLLCYIYSNKFLWLALPFFSSILYYCVGCGGLYKLDLRL